MTRRMMSQLSALLISALIAPGCVALGDGPLFGTEDQGYTECGDFFADPGEDVMCPPGRYCDDPTFSECADGCLSNDNCAEDQRCVKADGTQVGACQAEIKRPASTPRDGKPSATPGESTSPRGFVSCGEGYNEITCHPGQYCANPDYGRCAKGCLSDLNCGSEQICDKLPGENLGTCQRS